MQNQEESQVIDDIDAFAAVVLQWHNKCLHELSHTLKVPTGTEVCIDDEPPIVLEGELLKGFLLGIQASLVCIGKLPFFAEDDKAANEDSLVDTSTPEMTASLGLANAG
jgi:hypothetical protein